VNHEHSSPRMLLVSRESSALAPLWGVSKLNSWQLDIASSGLEAVEHLESGPSPDLVLVDLTPGDKDGLHTLRWLRRTRPELSVILLSEPGEDEQMREAERLGMHDCVMKPCQEPELERAIKAHLNGHQGHTELEPADELDQMIANLSLLSDDPAIQKLRTRAEQLAQLDVPVLLLGENSNSKGLIARLIHKMSTRCAAEFVKLNCAALSPELLEQELFGYDWSGLAGGARRKTGKLEQCDGGTLLLDELAQMPVSLQSRVLQVMDSRQFVLPGSETVVSANVRIVAAVNLDAEKAIAENKLSEDLYYRLSASSVYVPPLKELHKQTVADAGYGLKSLVRDAKGEAEKKAIAVALEETHWNRKAAARLLRISYRALLYKIQQYQMSPPNAYLSPNLLLQNGAKEN
jgi:DNA-binding NtrC family response regulator